MLKRYHHFVGGIFRVADASVIGLAWILAYGLRFYLPFLGPTKELPPFEKYAALSPLVMILWLMTLSSMRVYSSKRLLRRTDEIHLLLKSHGIALLFFIAITYWFSEYKYSRGVMIYFGILGAVLITLLRLLMRNGLREIRKRGFNLRHVLLVGEGAAVETLIRRIDKFPELGLRTLGIVTHESSTAQSVLGKSVVGHFTSIRETVQKYLPDQLILALPRNQYVDLDRILGLLRDETLDIQLIPDIHEYITLGCEIEDFDGLPVVNLNDSPLNGWGGLAKRLTDILISSVAIILLTPLLLFLSILIKLSSRGPILYSQERMGLDGRVFRMLKFRSMRADAEDETGAVWARPDDDRRTWLGAFLRSTSLDELPQLWNVLRGEMSVVGPRPERPIFVQKFRNDIPHYMLRHKVKAGMTGWAQVNGWRGNTPLNHRIECDLFYIRNWSYLLDWKIITMTLWKGLINKNAY